MNKEQWTGFNEGRWAKHIDVRNFIQTNYTEYTGDEIGRASCRERV